ncbi:MAG: prolipoprotein diacylglyceryl transferase [Planctomycetes bacterium]|nr:prolipoprotein diacylglyceryl transferase [Planctomycetota bacterium]
MPLFGVSLHAHVVFEVLAYALAFRVYLARKRRFGDPLAPETRWLLVAAAAVGAAIGSKLLSWFVYPAALAEHAGDVRWLMQQKTIVGAILGGWIAVEFAKHKAGVATRTGDLFAVPLCVGIAVGRVGCFLAGLDDRTFGSPSALPWAIDFGDGVARHPVQLYESAFALLLAVVLHRREGLLHAERARAIEATSVSGLEREGVDARATAPGSVFRAFLAAYFAFRVAVDFLKPVPTFAGLGTLQWASLAALAWIAWPSLARWLRARRGAVESHGGGPARAERVGRAETTQERTT